MWYKTDLMDKILKSEAAQRIIDYVSDIYGESYVGLWLYQIIGVAIDDINNIINQLFDEIFPDRSQILLSYWEKEYGIIPNKYLSTEERHSNLTQKINSKKPMNPKRVEMLVEGICGGKCELIENIAPFTFEIRILSENKYINIRNVVDLVNEVKPAHLNYKTVCTCRVNLGIKADCLPWKTFFIQTGTIPKINTGLAFAKEGVEIHSNVDTYEVEYESSGNNIKTGTIPQVSTGLSVQDTDIEIRSEGNCHGVQYPKSGESGPAGTYPILSTALSILKNDVEVLPDTEGYKVEYIPSGEDAETGMEPRTSTGLAVAHEGVEVQPGAESYLVSSAEAGTEPKTSTGYDESEGGVLPEVKTESWQVDFTLCGDDSGL